MNLLIIAIILAAIPLINWLAEYYFSKKDKQLTLFKKHFTCFYTDLILIPFNFFAAFAINLSSIYLLGIIILAILSALILYPYWARVHKKENNPIFMFNAKTQKVSKAGISHFIFQIIETIIVFSFLFSSLVNIFSYLASAFLLVFILLLLVGSRKIHKKFILSDVFFVAFSTILLVIRVLRPILLS